MDIADNYRLIGTSTFPVKEPPHILTSTFSTVPWPKQLVWIINMGYYHYIVICLSAQWTQCLQFHRDTVQNRNFEGEKKPNLATLWTLLFGRQDCGMKTGTDVGGCLVRR